MVTLRLRNRTEELARLREEVFAFAQRHAFGPVLEASLQLVLEEVVANIIHHAYRDDAEHEILVQISLDDRAIRVRVEDDGVPFDPGRDRPVDVSSPLEERQIGGMGIHLLRGAVDELTYRREIGRNIVTMQLHRTDG